MWSLLTDFCCSAPSDYNAALPLLESAVKELSGALGPQHQATAVAQRELARTLLELGEHGRARAVAVEALRILDATVRRVDGT